MDTIILKMKRFGSFFILILLLAVASPVFAEDTSTDIQTNEIKKIEENREMRQEKINDARVRAGVAKDEALQKIEGNFVERFNHMLATVNANWVNRWENLLSRLNKIFAKIQTRLARMEEAGVDTAGLQEKVEGIGDSLADIEAMIAAQAEKEYILTETDDLESLHAKARELKMQMREDHGIIKNTLKSVHVEMKELVREMNDMWMETKKTKSTNENETEMVTTEKSEKI